MRNLMMLAAMVLAACSGTSEPMSDDPNEEPQSAAPDMSSPDEDTGPTAQVAASACQYSNPFSGGPECREYVGEWTTEQIDADCAAQQGEVFEGTCEAGFIGTCSTPIDAADGDALVYAYGDATSCQPTGFACRTFAGGTWEPTDVCSDDEGGGPTTNAVFQPPERICRDPLPGEPAGAGPNGQVCTWQLISGATEEGRKFVDYASCDVVRTQRPYYPFSRPDDAERDDPRMNDPTYVAELGWVKSQIEASACVCCHQSSLTPDGASNWDIDQPGNFMNGFYDKGLALGANWVNSIALGAFPPEENNGFERDTSGFPSTEPERMRAFFIAELEYRGLSEADFAETPPFGGPLYDQIFYEPAACPDGVGVASDLTVSWEGGDARYLYLLEVGARSPTVPPNLDTPTGTLWRLDVAPDSDPLASGSVVVGAEPRGTSQVVPAQGEPDVAVGEEYYLYVAADVAAPLTRCITRVGD